MNKVTVGDLGEKELIRTIVRPLLNPRNEPDLPGDDCGVSWLRPDLAVLVSTDRVPWDLISFDLGLIDIWGMGYYLAVLNISDIAAMGGRPLGLVINLALPSSFPVSDVEALLSGAEKACAQNDCKVLGGDFSNSDEPSISAAVVGTSVGRQLLRRAGADSSHRPYCSDVVGLTPTAFAYFRDAKPRGFRVRSEFEELLVHQFSMPKARVELGQQLVGSSLALTCMDNTDGLAQSLLEIAQEASVGFVLERSAVPLHPVTVEVAEFLQIDPLILALRPGADFQLVGSFAGDCPPHSSIVPIGRVGGRPGTLAIEESNGDVIDIQVEGWNYFQTRRMGDLT